MRGYICPVCGKAFGREIKDTDKYPRFKVEAKMLWRHLMWHHPEYMIEWFEKNRERWTYMRRKLLRMVLTSREYETALDLDVDRDGEARLRCFFWNPTILKYISDKYIESRTVVNEHGCTAMRNHRVMVMDEIVDTIGSYWFKHERPDLSQIEGEVVRFVR